MVPLHILGAGSIGLLSVHLIRKACPSLPIFLLRRTPGPPGKVDVSVHCGKNTYQVDEIYEDDPTLPINQLLITTKAPHTLPAFLPLLPRLTPHTLYVFLQNGLHVHTPLLPLLPSPSPQVVLGTTTHGVFRQKSEKNSIQWVAAGTTLLAPTIGTILSDSQKEWLRALGELTDFPTLENSLFRKAALNACINPVTALFRIKNGEIAEDQKRTKRERERAEEEEKEHQKSNRDSKSVQKESTREGPWVWVERLAKETREVMKSERPELDFCGLEEEVAKLTHQTRENTNSMLADILSGQETEIDYINGAIAKLGRKHGVPTPWHDEIIARVKSLEKK